MFRILQAQRISIFSHEKVSYLDYIEKLQDTRLSPRELFFSSLTGDPVSESDYAHAVNYGSDSLSERSASIVIYTWKLMSCY